MYATLDSLDLPASVSKMAQSFRQGTRIQPDTDLVPDNMAEEDLDEDLEQHSDCILLHSHTFHINSTSVNECE